MFKNILNDENASVIEEGLSLCMSVVKFHHYFLLFEVFLKFYIKLIQYLQENSIFVESINFLLWNIKYKITSEFPGEFIHEQFRHLLTLKLNLFASDKLSQTVLRFAQILTHL